MLRRLLPVFLFAVLLVAFTGCDSAYYAYHYVPGKTAILRGGYAFAPPGAPPQVERAIAAGNRIAGLPYRWGGGHGCSVDTGYDCSGSASFVLREAGLVQGCMISKEFRDYGQAGEGEWINVYAKNGHVFLAVAGVRFDTGWTDGSEGPQWTIQDRPASGCVVRHPVGL
ncbi:MAG: peptidoglycan endopeptidase [Chthoniobacter sp.]|uniref:peptidoglycan endopeptidase n=1 Tax=Chthoniobacter sp. TaxID=2510640 RepID=UPI0032A517D7